MLKRLHACVPACCVQVPSTCDSVGSEEGAALFPVTVRAREHSTECARGGPSGWRWRETMCR
eukprot:5594213-Pleurochrysis_carterae.AAC.2